MIPLKTRAAILWPVRRFKLKDEGGYEMSEFSVELRQAIVN